MGNMLLFDAAGAASDRFTGEGTPMRSRTRSAAAVAALTCTVSETGVLGDSLTLARRRQPTPRSVIGEVQPPGDRRSAFLSLERQHD
jgi:hypothetical protein